MTHMTTADWWATGGVTVVVACVGWLREKADKARAARGLPPREPVTDMSPFMLGLLTGSGSGQAYFAPVRAVTPSGIRVRQARCCPRGHQSPAQAVTHARGIAGRIERTGR